TVQLSQITEALAKGFSLRPPAWRAAPRAGTGGLPRPASGTIPLPAGPPVGGRPARATDGTAVGSRAAGTCGAVRGPAWNPEGPVTVSDSSLQISADTFCYGAGAVAFSGTLAYDHDGFGAHGAVRGWAAPQAFFAQGLASIDLPRLGRPLRGTISVSDAG